MNNYHALLARVERNPQRWCHLSMTSGREPMGNIIEQGRGSDFFAVAFDHADQFIGTFGTRKAARRAVCEAFRRRQPVPLAS